MWNPIAGALVPIQRVPRGFESPGGTGSSPAAQGEVGGTQLGVLILGITLKLPVGVPRGQRQIVHALGEVLQRDAPAARSAGREAELLSVAAAERDRLAVEHR